MKSNKFPRIIIGAGASGAGKTTTTCAIIKALVNRKLSVASFKCGPDYIDTMFHGKIVGEKSRNLDPYFFSDNTLRFLLANHAEGKDSCRLLAVDTTSCCLDDGSVSIEFTAEEEWLATLVPGQAFELIGIIRMQPHGAQNIAVIAAESLVPLDGMVSDIQW